MLLTAQKEEGCRVFPGVHEVYSEGHLQCVYPCIRAQLGHVAHFCHPASGDNKIIKITGMWQRWPAQWMPRYNSLLPNDSDLIALVPSDCSSLTTGDCSDVEAVRAI